MTRTLDNDSLPTLPDPHLDIKVDISPVKSTLGLCDVF